MFGAESVNNADVLISNKQTNKHYFGLEVFIHWHILLFVQTLNTKICAKGQYLRLINSNDLFCSNER